MGFKRNKKVLKLVWPEGNENHGLEVRATSCPTGDLLKIVNMAKAIKQDEGNTDPSIVEDMFGSFAKCLVSWNLEDDVLTDEGPVVQAVPATVEGLKSQDFDFVMDLIKAWIGAVSQVSEDEGKGSASGERFPEASIPMEAL